MNVESFRAAEAALWRSYGQNVVEHRVDVGGASVRVQEIGNRGGHPIVFIHGSPNAGSIYAPLAAQLPQARCLLLDRPGTGLSDKIDDTPATRKETVVRVLDAVVDALAIDKTHIVGSSMGGWWALVYALARPDRVARMIQHGCPAGLPGEKLPFGVRMLAIPGMQTLMTSMKPTPSSVKMAFSFIGHKQSLREQRIDPAILDWYLSVLRDTDTQKREVAADASVIRLFEPAMRELALSEAELRALRAPSAILWGTHDNFGGIDIAKRTRDVLPGADMPSAFELVEGGGHLPWLDAKERAARQALVFFDA